jgi:hypothetical protein
MKLANKMLEVSPHALHNEPTQDKPDDGSSKIKKDYKLLDKVNKLRTQKDGKKK